MEAAPATVGRIQNRVFRPVLWWIVVSSLLLGWRFHYTRAARATIRVTVSLEGSPRLVFPKILLNGESYSAGAPSGLGRRALRVSAPGYESFETNAFIWYGGADWGGISLMRSRGRLDLDFSPAAESVQIQGAETNSRLDHVAQDSLLLPTGPYSVEAKFARFSVKRTAEVTRNQTARVALAPSITALNLTSVPGNAEFELRSVNPPEIGLKGRTPSIIADLPSGEYSLAIWRGGYRKELSTTLSGTRATNDLAVEFHYAKVSVTSEPSNATISDGNGILGRTPAVLDLPPGFYRLYIEKAGHFGTNFSLTLSETDSRTVSVSLANVSFVEALARARSAATGSSPDYDSAWADVEKALRIKPDDAGALGLKRTIEFNLHLRNAKRLQGRGDFAAATLEADAAQKLGVNDAVVVALKDELQNGQLAAEAALEEARRKAELAEKEARSKADAAQAAARRIRPQELLQETTRKIQYDELFEPQTMRFMGSLETVRVGVARALAAKPEWSGLQNEALDADTVVLKAENKGLLTKHIVVLVVGQSADNEVTVCFKLFSLLTSGLGESSYVPRHPRFLPSFNAEPIEAALSKDISDFRKRLEAELH